MYSYECIGSGMDDRWVRTISWVHMIGLVRMIGWGMSEGLGTNGRFCRNHRSPKNGSIRKLLKVSHE